MASKPKTIEIFLPDGDPKSVRSASITNGRILVVEYKGSQFAGGDDAEEKELIGKIWAEKSGNLFLMAWKKDDQQRDINQQMMRYLGNVKK